MADIIAKADYQVAIEGTTYSMVAIPEASSALVTKQKDRVLRNSNSHFERSSIGSPLVGGIAGRVDGVRAIRRG
jgi:hypothetical protein